VAPPTARPSAWTAWGRNVVLFLLTAASVYLIGGPWLAVALLSILLAHEMGHYIACLYYRVDATLPFFIPFPFPLISLVGTLGAFIRIRSPIPHRRALFDIGIAGPLAGFAVCLPVMALSVREMTLAPTGPASSGLYLGDPLLLQWLTSWALGRVPEGMTVVIGPLGLAAWFGLFVTALNLIPVGQLDGGHVVYALFGPWASIISRVGWWVCVGLVYFSPSWLVWAILIRILGRQHPRTLNDYDPVGRGRVLVGLLGLAVFAVCFIPSPIAGSWDALLEGLGILPPS
jgi:membrane-associated protease RseP (regulator of RpoE activity)